MYSGIIATGESIAALSVNRRERRAQPTQMTLNLLQAYGRSEMEDLRGCKSAARLSSEQDPLVFVAWV